MLTAIPNGIDSFNFTITPPSASAVCVLSYTITATPSTTSNIEVNADRENPSAVIEVTRGGFDLCSNSYNFTLASVALDGSMESDGVNQAPLNLEGEHHYVANIFIMIVFKYLLDLGTIITGIRATSVGLVWTSLAPPTCFSKYIIETDENSTLQHNATTNMVLFEELNRSGFSYCINFTITITPVIRLTDMPLTNSQNSEGIVIIDPGKYEFANASMMKVMVMHHRMLQSHCFVRGDLVNYLTFSQLFREYWIH